MDYPVERASWHSPRGRIMEFEFRGFTNDWNTINACLGTNDEYGLADQHIDGIAVDIGGYVGSVAVAILIDNPSASVLVVEPVPDNVRLIRVNAELNGVKDRLTVFEGAAGPTGETTSEIRFGYVGDPNLEHHAFVGNTSLAYDTGGDVQHEALQVPTFGLAELLDRYGIDEPDFLKIDCEGGEWSFLDTDKEALLRLPYIIGEAHPVRGHRALEIADLLSDTHDVTLQGPNQNPGPCGFRAVRR